MTLGTLQNVLEAMVSVPLAHRRRVLEVGYGLGYVIVEIRCMDLPVIAIEIKSLAKTVQDIMVEDDDVVLLAMDVLDFPKEAFQASGCTSITCLIGVDNVTEHVIAMFLASPMAVELAYLVPADTTPKHEDHRRWRGGEFATQDFSVTFAGSNGHRRWVKLVRKTGFYIGVI